MGIGIVSLLCAISAGAWVYNKMYHQSGGNTQSSLIFAGVVAGFVFMVVYTIGGLIL